MATHTRAELGGVFECDLSAGGLDEFEPEDERGAPWRRVASPTAVDVVRWEPYVALAHPRVWPLVLPVVMAAAIAGIAVSWLGQRENESPASSSHSVAANEIASADTAAAHTAPVAPVVPEPLIPVQMPAPVAASPVTLEPAFEATLAAVTRSYRDLDAAALTGVWPGADTASLEQSFSALKYQSMSFDRCTTRPNGSDGVLASCDVSIAAAPKSGEPALERRRESWTLVLRDSGDRWTIAGVSVRAN